MRFIHTADLHIGNKIHDIERGAEYRDFFGWLKNTIVENQVEGLIIAGDIYDTKTPSIESRSIFHRFLASLLDTCCKNVILVGGNHDSGPLLDSNKEILEALNIHVVGDIYNKNIEDLVFKLYDQEDNVAGICVAMPFVKESELKNYLDLDSDEEGDHEPSFALKTHKALYNQALAEAKKQRGDLQVPIIATGHLHAANLEGRYSEEIKDRPQDGVRTIDVVGNLGYVGAEAFSEEYDYVALGHIHYSTMVNKNPKIRYSGSPFIMGFDELKYARGVLLVTCDPKEGTSVNMLKTTSDYLFIRKVVDENTIDSCINDLVENASEDKTYYVQLRFKMSDRNMIYNTVGGYTLPENVMIVSYDVIRANESTAALLENRTMKDMKDLKEQDIFKSLILTKNPDGVEDVDALSEEEKETYVNKYLPYFMQAYNEVITGGDFDEDN